MTWLQFQNRLKRKPCRRNGVSGVDELDMLRHVVFPSRDGKTPHIWFGERRDEAIRGRRFRYEIILDSSGECLESIYGKPRTDGEYDRLADAVNASMKELYRRKSGVSTLREIA